MIKSVGECFYQIQNGANIKQGEVDGGFPITRIETTANDKFNRDRMGYAGITDITQYESYVLEDGDLLMSHINSVQYLGRTVLYVKQPNETIIHGMNLLRLKANKDVIDPAYAKYYFNGHLFRSELGKITKKSVNQASFTVKDLKKIKIVIPPMSEQERIVFVLDKIKVIIDNYQKQLEKYDELIKARFVEMFGDVKNEEKYKGIALKNICKTMSGGTPSTKNPEYYSGQIPWITTISLGGNYIDGNDAKGYITQQAIDNSATKLVPKDSILFGTRVGVGKSSINEVEMCTNQDIVAIINVDKNKYNNLFIKNVLDAYQPYYDSLKKGATILGITSDDLKNTLIPIVSLNLQNQFADFVKQIDKSKFVVQKSLDKAQLLFDSLMQEYFG